LPKLAVGGKGSFGPTKNLLLRMLTLGRYRGGISGKGHRIEFGRSATGGKEKGEKGGEKSGIPSPCMLSRCWRERGKKKSQRRACSRFIRVARVCLRGDKKRGGRKDV